MKSKGQVVIYSMMIAIVLFVLALALAPVLKDFISSATSATVGDAIGMDCDATTNNFTKAACLATDSINFLWLGFMIFMAGAIIYARVVFS